MDSFSYFAHGLHIQSQIPLPEYVPSQPVAHPQIKICVEELTQTPASEFECSKVAEGFKIGFAELGQFLVARGGEIRVQRKSGVTDASIRLPMLGSILAVALHYQGILALHGNALSINGAGVIILGDKGQGKSTLTAYLLSQGHKLVSDDVSAVTINAAETALVHRGALQLRLWPDSIERCFGKCATDFEPVNQWSEKRSVPVQAQGCEQESVRVHRIYELGENDAVRGETITSGASWYDLVGHTHVSRFGSVLLQGADAMQNFSACARLGRRLPLRNLLRPKDFNCLEEVKNFIEADVAGAD